MSDVTESTIPVENEAGEPLSKALLVLVKEQQADIIASGVEITKVVIRMDGGPPRYHIKFLPGESSAQVRLRLEAKHYDVGQSLGARNLSFYVTKRVVQTRGWDV